MFGILITALLVLTIAALPAKAEELGHATQDNRSLETGGFAGLLDKLRQNPEIASYNAKAESLLHYSKGELGLPDPTVFVEEQDYPIGSSTSQMQEEKMVGFKQEIPAFGTRGAKAEKTEAEAHKTRLAGDFAFAAMKAKLITVLANLQRIKQQEKLLDEQASLFASERTSIKGRIAANQSGVSELSMVEAESTEVQLMRAQLDEEKHEIMAMLTNMLGETPDVDLPLIAPAAWAHDADKTYPVRIAAEDITMAHKDVAVREADFNPHFEVQASYGRMYGGDKAGTVMVGLSIPLWAAENQRARLDGAKAALRSSELDQDAVRRYTIEKLDHLQAQIETSGRKIKLLKSKNAHLETSAKALTREYVAGKADVVMYVKARREAISARISLAQERANRIALIADFNHYLIGE
ncbi:MAG: TolC family protein [Planctomycetes bacterium]|nr:TolC family protein [Planctomycetota bacterium]